MHRLRVSSVLWSPLTLAAAMVSLFSAPAAAQTDFTRVPGQARSIGIGANGAIWVIGWGKVAGSDDYDIWRWAGTQWQKTSGSGVKIAVDPAGNALVVNSLGNMYRYSFAGNPPWEQLSGKGKDIAAGANGALWMIGVSQPAKPDEGIFQWTNQAWEQAPGAAVQIAVAPDGAPWVVNSENELYERDIQQKKWIEHPIKLRSVAIGPTGAKFAVSTTDDGGGNFRILQHIGNDWIFRSASGVAVAVGPSGEPWVLTAAGEILRGTAKAPLNLDGVIVLDSELIVSPTTPEPGLTAPVFVNPPPAPWGRHQVPFNEGEMLCSGSCGTTRADWVGAYQLDLTCDRGTYSPLYGGTCWACPANDGQGNPWNINLVALEKDEGCWRVPFPRYSKATWVKLGWAWDCDSSQGEFWDTHNAAGQFVFGGSCWKCADPEFPRRSANFIAGPSACVTPVQEIRRPTLLTFNGCPQPDAAAMALKGERQPDKPFLDIAGGWSTGVAAGGCFACPVVDENGDVVIASRNADPITDRSNNNGCDVRFRWKLPSFPEPGLSGLEGVKEILFEKNLLLRPDDISFHLRFVGDAKGFNDAQVDEYVRTEWQNITKTPYQSETVRSLVYSYLRAAVEKPPAERTSAEQKLLASFENYIRVRRTFLAQQALNMYDAWKESDDRQRQSYRRSILADLFYYGTVPLDFHKTLESLTALGTTGAGLAGTLASTKAFSHYVVYEGYRIDVPKPELLRGEYIIKGEAPPPTPQSPATRPSVPASQLPKKTELHGMYRMKAMDIFKGSRTALSIASGATIIQAAFAVLQSIAIDQFVAIVTARPKLEAVLAAADQPVDLAGLLGQHNGEDVVLSYWSKAMEVSSETEDSQIIMMAGEAHAKAAARQYW